MIIDKRSLTYFQAHLLRQVPLGVLFQAEYPNHARINEPMLILIFPHQ
jgi:hypothetical protein